MFSVIQRRSRSFVRFVSKAASCSRENFTPVIGLEVHVQLATKTKLFSRTPVSDDSPPNSRVSNFDMAEPGTLPRLNKLAVMNALKMAQLLNCTVPNFCRFDRKHYFYADMPAGYQITQHDHPIATKGRFGFHVYSDNISPYWKEVDIFQLQLEQDSGKTIHVGSTSLIDLNRAGIPLVEVVTAPDFSSALEALCFVQQLRLLLMHYKICDGELHKGHMRVDANVSLSQNGEIGVRTEIKNMNSMRHLYLAINYEIYRQYEIISNGGKVVNETRAYDQQGRTVSMRDKEEETDYRFLPEPNLPTLKIQSEWIDNCRQILENKPIYKYFIDVGFDPRTAIYYAEDPLLCQFVSNCIPRFQSVSTELFNLWLRELKQIFQKSKAVYPPQSSSFANKFMTILEFYTKERITKLTAIELIKNYVSNAEKRSVEEIIQRERLERICNISEIDCIGQTAFAKHGKLIEKAKAGNTRALNKLRAEIVEISGKRIDINDATACVNRLLQQQF